MSYQKFIREIPDFPKPGILFYDITTLLNNATGLQAVINDLVERFRDAEVRKVVGIESRGFIFGAPLAYHLKAGFVPVRKPGKLPADVFEVKYELEYGSNSLAIHRDAIEPGERILVVDDLLATGGTAAATVQLIEQLGGEIVGCAFLIELLSLQGREKLKGCAIHTLLTYP